MIELTPEQQQAVAQTSDAPPRAVDPVTQTTYVLIREDVYDRVKSAFQVDDDNQALRDLHPHVMEVFGRSGWDDPAMDVYEKKQWVK